LSRLIFNKISIVESLADTDKKTGELLAHDLSLLEVFHDKGLVIECLKISNKQELLTHIESLTEDAKINNVFPILQIEVHGTSDQKGLALNSGENVSWNELEPYFRALNVATKCNLLVVMAACFGVHVSSNISLFDRAPYWGIIAPEKEILPNDILSTLTRFYTQLYTSEESNGLLASLQGSELEFITSEWFFVKAFKYYITEFCNDTDLTIKVNSIKNKLIAQGVIDLPGDEIIKCVLKPEGEERFYSFLNHFFMVDYYPENIDKISVKYDHINP